jgi:hypothetical protein
MRAFAIAISLFLAASMVLLGAVPEASAASNPPNCPKTGLAFSLGEFRDLSLDDQCSGGLNDGADCGDDSECPGGGQCSPGETPITGPLIQGETIYYEAALSFNPTACGYQGGELCIDLPSIGGCPSGNPAVSPRRCVQGPNANANCAAGSECPGSSCVVVFGSQCCDVTPNFSLTCNGGTNDNSTCSVDSECPGGGCSGVPLICPAIQCNPFGLATLTSRQVPYVVRVEDSDRTGTCQLTELRVIAHYWNGVSHQGPNDIFPLDGDSAAECDKVVVPTPGGPTPTDVTATPTPVLGTPSRTRTPSAPTPPETTATPGPFACSPVPDACAAPPHGKGLLRISSGGNSGMSSLVWRWGPGSIETKAELGNPLPDDGTQFVLCIYDGNASLIEQASVHGGGVCGATGCWRDRASGFSYRAHGVNDDGIQTLTLRAGDGAARLTLMGKGSRLDTPAMPIVPLPVVVELKSSAGSCWSAAYGTTRTNLPGRFVATAD